MSEQGGVLLRKGPWLFQATKIPGLPSRVNVDRDQVVVAAFPIQGKGLVGTIGVLLITAYREEEPARAFVGDAWEAEEPDHDLALDRLRGLMGPG